MAEYLQKGGSSSLKMQGHRASSPSRSDLRPSLHALNGSESPLPSPKTRNPQQADTRVPTDSEASDYWNSGSPHGNITPIISRDPSRTPRTPSAVDGVESMNPRPHDVLPLSPEDNVAPGTAAQSRRSVQFARSDVLETPHSHSRQGSWDGPESSGRSRGAAIMSKIKSLAGNSSLHLPRQMSASMISPEVATASQPASPIHNGHGEVLVEEPDDADVDADADVEEMADEENGQRSTPLGKKKKRVRRSKKTGLGSPPARSRLAQAGDSLSAYNRLLRRRASMPNTSGHDSDLSEDDEELGHHPGLRGFRRGSAWINGGMRSQGEDSEGLDGSVTPGRRLGHQRRITLGDISDGDAAAQRRPFFDSGRASSYGANKWKQVKNTLKLLRQKKQDRIDYLKSAELMAELRAGAPAVLMFASMIQRDEHGNRRIPVLLEQLKVKVQDSFPIPYDDKERHWIFTMRLEYGSGPSRMSWTVTRTIREIYNLHLRYKLKLNNEKYIPGRLDLGARLKQPKFPYSAFPYLRNARIKGDESDDDDDANSVRAGDSQGAAAAGEGLPNHVATDGEGSRPPTRRRRSRVNLPRIVRQSTGMSEAGDASNAETQSIDLAARRQRYVEKQRREVEKYLSEMIRWLMFRADSNRLCRFLELSALGVRLAVEGSYHGKEGYLHIQSSKGLDFRRVLTPAKVISRHSRKWFLVRQSYIVCVESPENMNIYDVYLVDANFAISSKRSSLKQMRNKDKTGEIDLANEAPARKHHTLTLHTSERKVRLFSRYQSAMKQFEDSINEMLKQTPWYQKKRFDSFAPVRTGVFAQWLVDGRDYMWNVSRAINMAKDVIYIHDWWLSPELYMRRPACISQKWRLDRLLQKKAREGVKIFIIIYRNVEAAIPIDSEYSKFSLLNLHPNIFVQRSPNQFKKNQFFFAHHEKICVVDHDVAFVGGIDLCFGRWDCPQHPIVDDKPTGFELSEIPKDAEHCQLFPGKDYSNPRVQDFFRLNEPYEEMYDRTRVPRMPWHDVAMQVVGQPARDLTRHFVQRWNYLRRGRRPTRPLPFLLPPPDAKVEELEALGLTGTCEVQILRSATTWSLGTDGTEHSIQTAYIKMIEDSEHFVYIENQFFITSTEVYGNRIANRIGDALVNRIIRAYENDEDWRCAIIIPLMPGFQNAVDEQEGTSVRLILMCQYKSICRGEQSLFGRLRAAGIEPEDYINFYSLRQWGITSNNVLVTEQLYIHGKTIIVDDRVALIGSANINERSMLGTRDSECAAIVRDTDMIWSTMAGAPYRVARFAHTLRLRLMREHLGLDVDEIMEQERQLEFDGVDFEDRMDEIYPDVTATTNLAGNDSQNSRTKLEQYQIARAPSFNHDFDISRMESVQDRPASSSSAEATKAGRANTHPANRGEPETKISPNTQEQPEMAKRAEVVEGRDSVVINYHEFLVHQLDTDGKGTLEAPRRGEMPNNNASGVNKSGVGEQRGRIHPPLPPLDRRSTQQTGLLRFAQLTPLPYTDDTDIGGPPIHFDPDTGEPTIRSFHPMAADLTLAHIDKDCMRDPVNSSFFDDVWNRAAQNNTKLYRRVFRCMPDSDVKTWGEYREFMDYADKFRASMESVRPKSTDAEVKPEQNLHAAGAGTGASASEGLVKGDAENQTEYAPEKLGGKLPHPTHDSFQPKVAIPETETEEWKEEQNLDEAGQPQCGCQTGPAEREANTGAAEQPEGEPILSVRSAGGEIAFPELEKPRGKASEDPGPKERDRKATFSTGEKSGSREPKGSAATMTQNGTTKRRRRATTRGSRHACSVSEMPSRNDAEELLKMIQGNLVQFPYDWLITEEHNGNWSYQVDGVAPLVIYN